jgi:hypothetical protein
MGRAFYVASPPPPGNLAQGRWRQPALTLLDFGELLRGNPDVPYHTVVFTFDGTLSQQSQLNIGENSRARG